MTTAAVPHCWRRQRCQHSLWSSGHRPPWARSPLTHPQERECGVEAATSPREAVEVPTQYQTEAVETQRRLEGVMRRHDRVAVTARRHGPWAVTKSAASTAVQRRR